MEQQPAHSEPRLYTIGHSNHAFETFLALLQARGVDTVVDVRTRPRSRFPWFNQPRLADLLDEAGVRYIYLGEKLGGQPQDIRLYALDGAPDYYTIARQDFFREGIEQVLRLVREGRRVALMCGEAEPDVCHRERLVGQALRAHGVAVEHILKAPPE